MKTKRHRRLPVRLAAVPVLPALAVAFAFVAGGSGHGGSAQRLRSALDSPGGEPGEVSLTKVERYWQTRLTYPTGRFDQRWVARAARQARRIKAGIPKGRYGRRLYTGAGSSRRSGAQATASLPAARALGPQPQASTGCQAPCFTFGFVSGRVSAIAFDPAHTNVAYLAQDGGGIWKTTNCCNPATTWSVTTDVQPPRRPPSTT